MVTSFQLLTALALAVAVLALLRARRATRRLERLAESYWELRYEHSQLRARVARLEGTPDAAATASQPAATAFVPLSSLKKREPALEPTWPPTTTSS